MTSVILEDHDLSVLPDAGTRVRGTKVDTDHIALFLFFTFDFLNHRGRLRYLINIKE